MSSSIDPTVAALLDRHPNAESDDEDALIASLENDADDSTFTGLREQRLQQLHSEFQRAQTMRASGTGNYAEIKDEKQVLDITTQTKLCLVHFCKSDFGRCAVIDRHLEILAPKHFDTRFLKIDVDNAPFLVTKLKVQVLPCLISFVDGLVVDRIIGFEGLGHGDSFTTNHLEARLLQSGLLVRSKLDSSSTFHVHSSSSRQEVQEDDDDDWD